MSKASVFLKGMGNSKATMNFMIECAQEAWETLGAVLLNKLAEGVQKRVDAVKVLNRWYIKY